MVCLLIMPESMWFAGKCLSTSARNSLPMLVFRLRLKGGLKKVWSLLLFLFLLKLELLLLFVVVLEVLRPGCVDGVVLVWGLGAKVELGFGWDAVILIVTVAGFCWGSAFLDSLIL